VIAVAAAATYWQTRERPIAVQVHVVHRGPVEATISNTRAGTVRAHRRAHLAPAIGGIIDELTVCEGDLVTKGQLLLRLWNQDLLAQCELARRELQRAAAMLHEATLRAELAERQAERIQKLSTEGIASPEAVDQADIDAKAAKAARLAAEADVEVRRQQQAVLATQLERTIIRAPFDGVVAEVNGEVGEFVTPAPLGIPTPPAIDLIDAGTPYVLAPIDEIDAAQVTVGMTARITLDAFGDRPFRGRVQRIAPYVLDREKQARTTDIEVAFLDLTDDLAMLPGYSADVEVLLARNEDALFVPTSAIRPDGSVWILTAPGLLDTRIIKTGLTSWTVTEVVGGLAEGDAVVLGHSLPGLIVGSQAVAVPP
jgi:HlyD family secretion protein